MNGKELVDELIGAVLAHNTAPVASTQGRVYRLADAIAGLIDAGIDNATNRGWDSDYAHAIARCRAEMKK